MKLPPEVIMSIVRFLVLLSLVVWVGGLIFFAFVLAPTVFNPDILPTRQLAGNVVSRSLGILHWMAISCGVIFAITSMIDSRVINGAARRLAPCRVQPPARLVNPNRGNGPDTRTGAAVSHGKAVIIKKPSAFSR